MPLSRHFRFRLRTLLVVAAAIAALLLPIGRYFREHRKFEAVHQQEMDELVRSKAGQKMP